MWPRQSAVSKRMPYRLPTNAVALELMAKGARHVWPQRFTAEASTWLDLDATARWYRSDAVHGRYMSGFEWRALLTWSSPTAVRVAPQAESRLLVDSLSSEQRGPLGVGVVRCIETLRVDGHSWEYVQRSASGHQIRRAGTTATPAAPEAEYEPWWGEDLCHTFILDLLEPLCIVSSVRFERISAGPVGYVVKGQPRVVGPRDYAAVVHPAGAEWRAVISATCGVVLGCQTLVGDAILSRHDLKWTIPRAQH